ncbi:hypothetical protein VOLCADRAFT_97603 [Volvox carteri f. nagariensis]|uniref:Pherophorin domain-containing protein n=1 Tax=Volvox carteri f. nagariensis TaxID=3068 RepID=D8UD55_VOLCA|nr:uncharacterized protein VOLCADRAFT_97603 [Volvox carteri f. nagariensis]EFJ42334.1 hypothetical protein VOLCADRAFT_97603 [Volvox carteri f. nagariensis]|eukprot:XP_002956567.1 hypothetical protein VOLCADRAFT_97603 [Volvox carteri f. nagariensis]
MCINQQSPYTLIPLPPVQRAGFVRTCFRVAYVGCDRNLACCRELLGSVQRLILDTNPQCVDQFNLGGVLVNGQPSQSWSISTHDSGYELKISNLQASNSTFPGSTICIVGYPECSTWADVCRGYPARGCSSSSTSGAFTFGNGANCTQLENLIAADIAANAAALNNMARAPYAIGNLSTSPTKPSTGLPAVSMCFTVGSQACNSKYSCCQMDFAKVEIPISPVCKSAVQEIRVDGKKVSYSWDAAKFCLNGKCQVNIYSTDNKCCPATFIS